mmetsp:Transcript_19276/g.50091  ORF Transcript_19276/g.50091 Transcript_19276/m.50091 type:complete len:157 (-) Transcript_19276:113-583(-)
MPRVTADVLCGSCVDDNCYHTADIRSAPGVTNDTEGQVATCDWYAAVTMATFRSVYSKALRQFPAASWPCVLESIQSDDSLSKANVRDGTERVSLHCAFLELPRRIGGSSPPGVRRGNDVELSKSRCYFGKLNWTQSARLRDSFVLSVGGATRHQT